MNIGWNNPKSQTHVYCVQDATQRLKRKLIKTEQINAILTWHHFLQMTFSWNSFLLCVTFWMFDFIIASGLAWFLHRHFRLCVCVSVFCLFVLFMFFSLFFFLQKALLFPFYPDFIFHKVIYWQTRERTTVRMHASFYHNSFECTPFVDCVHVAQKRQKWKLIVHGAVW